jgi:hypothetical protein
MARYAGMRLIDVWYSGITETAIREAAVVALSKLSGASARQARLNAFFEATRGHDAVKAAAKLTTVVDDRLVIPADPPVIQRIDIPEGALARLFEAYRATMPHARRELLERYRLVDYALKVVGVGSVGTRCFIVVLEGRDREDPLILQVKEATASVLEPYVDGPRPRNHGERVVHGQQLMQAAPDILLGWCRAAAGRDFYFRQLWDMKGSVNIPTLLADGLAFYAGLCGWALAAAHARSGQAAAIAAYLGSGDTFDGAIADFSESYADVNARDHAAYVEAIKAGRLTTTADATTGSTGRTD